MIGDVADAAASIDQALRTFPEIGIIIAAVFGLVVGSFVNLLVHRLLLMLRQVEDSETQTTVDNGSGGGVQHFSPIIPRSHCPSCGHVLRWWEHIPVVSYLVMRGRCSACGKTISLQYPAVELACCAAAVTVILVNGIAWHTLGAMVLSFSLITVAVIDLEARIIPDDVVLPMLWLGLFCNAFGLYADANDAILGAVAGYLALWLIYWIYKLATGMEGLGFGDLKLAAMLGAWLGVNMLPIFLLVAFTAGTLVGVGLIIFAGGSRRSVVPFGPFLAAAGWITLLWGDQLKQFYLDWAFG